MKRRILFVLGALLSATMLFTSCGNDDDEVSICDPAVGKYTGSITMYALDFDGKMVSREDIFGKAPQLTATAYVEKGSTNNTMIINVGDKYQCSNLQAASNGFTFDIKTQTTADDATIIGFDVAELEGAYYNGLFLTSSKKLTFGVKIDVVDLDVDETIFNALLDEEVDYVVFVYELTK